MKWIYLLIALSGFVGLAIIYFSNLLYFRTPMLFFSTMSNLGVVLPFVMIVGIITGFFLALFLKAMTKNSAEEFSDDFDL